MNSGKPGAVSQLDDVRRVVSGLHRLHADVPEHQRVVDGDAGRQLRGATHVDDRRISRATIRSCARRRSTTARGPRARGRCATRSTTWSRPTSRRSTTPPSSRTSCSTTAISRRRTRSSSSARAHPTPTSSRRRSTIRTRPSNCFVAWRSWAFTSSSSIATWPTAARPIRRARG